MEHFAQKYKLSSLSLSRFKMHIVTVLRVKHYTKSLQLYTRLLDPDENIQTDAYASPWKTWKHQILNSISEKSFCLTFISW